MHKPFCNFLCQKCLNRKRSKLPHPPIYDTSVHFAVCRPITGLNSCGLLMVVRDIGGPPSGISFQTSILIRMSSRYQELNFVPSYPALPYFYVLAALGQQTATCLLDLISRPPVDDKYKKLKDRLIDTFGLSKHEQAFCLFHFRPLGDSKPSTLMDKMLGLLGDHPPCLLFEQFFLERLPEDIHIQLIDLKIEDHRQLAKWADTLWSS